MEPRKINWDKKHKELRKGYEQSLKDVLGLIDERIKMLKEITANSRHVNKQKALMEIFKATISELEELKAKIEGK